MSTRPVVECAVCRTDVPAGAFCAACGAHLDPPSDGRQRLRIRAYCAGRDEHLLRPSVVSSLFPRLAHRARPTFWLALAALLVATVVCTVLRLPAATIAVAAFGFPLLFLVYLRETGDGGRLSLRALLPTLVLGAVLGTGWALPIGDAVARGYDLPMGAGVDQLRILRDGLAYPLGAMLLMLIPALVVHPRPREPLHGFAIGALGALAFTSAATLIRLAPQVDDGVMDHDRPLSGLLIQAGIQAVAVPLTAAASGALVGLVRWSRTARVFTAVTVVGCYGILGVVDVAQVPEIAVLAVHLAVMAAALLAVRIGLQLVLLHPAPGPAGERQQCPQCDHVVAAMAFCENCGVATRTWAPYRAGGRRRVAAWGGVVVLLAGVLVAVSATVSDPTVLYVCPPDCGPPPISEPVATNPLFTAPDGSFSVSYPSGGAAYTVTTADDGVTADLLVGDGGTLQLFGRPAAGRTPKEVAEDLVADTYPDGDVDYEIPNAMVGYQPGYGMVVDYWPQNATGDYMRVRVIILAAVKNDLALIAVASGPYHEYSPDFGPGKPSAANLDLAEDMGKYVNSFRWRGDRAR